MGKTHAVYKLTSPSGKSYIGFTAQAVKSRWNDHRSAWKRGTRDIAKLCSAFDKYDPYVSDWTVTVLFESQDRDAALKAEQLLIQEYNTLQEGYNVIPGGTAGRLGIPHSNATKRKISESKSGKSIASLGMAKSPEHRAAISATLRGKPWSANRRQAQDARSKV